MAEHDAIRVHISAAAAASVVSAVRRISTLALGGPAPFWAAAPAGVNLRTSLAPGRLSGGRWAMSLAEQLEEDLKACCMYPYPTEVASCAGCARDGMPFLWVPTAQWSYPPPGPAQLVAAGLPPPPAELYLCADPAVLRHGETGLFYCSACAMTMAREAGDTAAADLAMAAKIRAYLLMSGTHCEYCSECADRVCSSCTNAICFEHYTWVARSQATCPSCAPPPLWTEDDSDEKEARA